MSTSNWSFDAKKAFAIFAILNWPFGLWPLLEVDLCLKIRLFFGLVQLLNKYYIELEVKIKISQVELHRHQPENVFTMSQILMAFATLYEVFQNCGNAEDSVENLLMFASAVIALSKLISYHLYRDKLEKNVKSAIRDWSTTKSVDYRDVMMSYKRIYKRITFALLTVVVSCTMLYFLRTMLMKTGEMIEVKDRRFPATNITQFVVKKRFVYPSTCTLSDIPETLYLVFLFNQILQICTCCIVAIGTDAFFLAIAAHLCGQFEILKMKFANIGNDANLPIANIDRRKLTGLILRHQHLLRLTELLEDAYNKIVLTQMLASVISISIAGFSFLIAMKANDIINSVKSLVVVQYMLLQSFMYTCIGEALHNQGDDVMQSVYDGLWYELPTYLSKDLVFVMMRSNIPPRLTAGKFFDMTRSSFMDVVKISSSYLSILRIMLNE